MKGRKWAEMGLSMAWQAHYAAVVVAGGVLGLAALLGTRPVRPEMGRNGPPGG